MDLVDTAPFQRLRRIRQLGPRTQLADASQALEWRRVHQVHHHSLGWGLAVKTNAAMQRVVIGPLASGPITTLCIAALVLTAKPQPREW